MADSKVISCSGCGARYDVSKYPDGYAFKCPKCGTKVVYQAPSPEAEPSPPAAPETPTPGPSDEQGMESEFIIIEDDTSMGMPGDDAEMTLGAADPHFDDGGGTAQPAGAPEHKPPSDGQDEPSEPEPEKKAEAPEKPAKTDAKPTASQLASQVEEARSDAASEAKPGIPATVMSADEADDEQPQTILEVSDDKAAKAGAPPGTTVEPGTPKQAMGSRFTATQAVRKHKAASQAKGKDKGKKTKMFGDFRVIKELGRGAMGVVYEAVQEPLGRRVALKVMLPSFTSSPEAVERFLRESKATAKLKHPNIVPVYGMGESEGTYYYAMGFIEGIDLKDALKDDVMPFKERAAILRDACSALHYAHGQGIVHRDIKPANIMIDKDKKVLITDFGIAKSEDQATLTASGQVLGTPMFMSPEQADGGASMVDARSDVYSLGATLYETITLARPYHGEDVRAIIRNVIETDPLPPRRIDPKIPKDLETICLKAMEKIPDKRYQTAGDMAQDLDHFIKGEPIVAKPLGLFGRMFRKARKNKLATLLILLLLLGTSGTGAFFGYSYMDKQNRIKEGLAKAATAFQEGEEDPDKYAEAQKLYASVLTIDDGNAAAKEGLEKCDLMLRQMADLKLQKTIKDKIKAAGEAYEAEEFEKARDTYAGILTLDKENAAARVGIEKCDLKLEQLADEKQRTELADKIAKALADAAAIFEQATDEPDKYFEAKDAYAKVLAMEEGNAAAREGIEKCNLMIKDINKKKMAAQVRRRLSEASEAFKSEEYRKARDLYAGVLTLDDENAAAGEGIEKCDLKLAQIEEERRRLEAKKRIEAILAEASQQFEEERYEEALKTYRKILALDEENAAAKVGIEKTELQIRHLKEEKEKYEKMQQAKALAAEGETVLAQAREIFARAEKAHAAGKERDRDEFLEGSMVEVGRASDKFGQALALYPGYKVATKGRVEANLLRARAAVMAADWGSAMGFLLAAKEAGADEFFPEEWAALHRIVVGTGTLSVATDPPGAEVAFAPVVADPAARKAPQPVGTTPVEKVDFPMGNVNLILRRDGYEPVTYPLMVERNEDVVLNVRLLTAEQIPEGMVYVPGGVYRRGDRYSGFEKVQVKGYLIDRTEVSHEAYHEWLKTIDDPSQLVRRLPRLVSGGKLRVFYKLETFERFQKNYGRNMPVWGVNRIDAMAYAAWRGKRLPTVDEWEKAARGVDGRLWPWGDTFHDDRCNFFGRRPNVMIEPVGAYEQWTSPFGCQNMAGNVGEWTATDGPLIRVGNREIQQGIIKGGTAASSKFEVMTNAQAYYKVDVLDRGIGFRCAMDLPEK